MKLCWKLSQAIQNEDDFCRNVAFPLAMNGYHQNESSNSWYKHHNNLQGMQVIHILHVFTKQIHHIEMFNFKMLFPTEIWDLYQ